MTTVVYDPKEKAIYYDSQLTAGNLILDKDFNKRFDYQHITLIATGQPDGVSDLINFYITREHRPSPYDTSGILWDRKNKTLVVLSTPHTEGEQYLLDSVDPNKPYALGSGSLYAYGAMDAGASGKRAVEIARDRDVNTGGKIRCLRVSIEN